jgi:hypothetical protein
VIGRIEVKSGEKKRREYRIRFVRFEVRTGMIMMLLWVVMPYTLLDRYQRLKKNVSIFWAEDGDTMFLRNVGHILSETLKMETLSFSETLVTTYESICRHNPEQCLSTKLCDLNSVSRLPEPATTVWKSDSTNPVVRGFPQVFHSSINHVRFY